MRSVALVIALLFYCADTDALPLDDWSWSDGLLGDSIAGDLYGDDVGYPGYFCPDCREPEDFTVDFAAFAYNGFFGEDSWMFGTRLGIPFRIYNSEMQWVVVWFEDLLFDGLTFLPKTMEVHVRLRSGQIIVITLLKDGPDLPVGVPDAEMTPGTCFCSDGESGGEDDYTEPDEYEFPELEGPSGTVEIIDPDEDDEFPEWEEEL